MEKAILPSGDTGIPNLILAKDGLQFSLNKRLQVLSGSGMGSFCHMAWGNPLPVFEWKFPGDTGIPNQILAKDSLPFSLNKRLQVLSGSGMGSFCGE